MLDLLIVLPTLVVFTNATPLPLDGTWTLVPFTRERNLGESVHLVPENSAASPAILDQISLQDSLRAVPALLISRVYDVIQLRGLNDEDEKPTAGSQDRVTLAEIGSEKRGSNQNKVYWRCYFNAVSCF